MRYSVCVSSNHLKLFPVLHTTFCSKFPKFITCKQFLFTMNSTYITTFFATLSSVLSLIGYLSAGFASSLTAMHCFISACLAGSTKYLCSGGFPVMAKITRMLAANTRRQFFFVTFHHCLIDNFQLICYLQRENATWQYVDSGSSSFSNWPNERSISDFLVLKEAVT